MPNTAFGRARLLLLAAAILGLLLGLLATTGCGTESSEAVTESGFVDSQVLRAQPSSADNEAAAALAEGNNAFGLDLFRTIRKPGENLVCSPYGLSTVLAMTYAGARSASAEAMARVLHFDLPQAQLHPAFNALDQALTRTGELETANSLWGSEKYSFNQSFVDGLAQNYGAGLSILDFTQKEETRDAINEWVSDKTSGRIPEMVGPDGIPLDPEPVLVLIDAVYFKAQWTYPFGEGQTWDGPFRLLSGTEVTVPLMYQENVLANGEGKDFQAVELPYSGGRFSMLLVLPAEGMFEEFASSFDDARLAEILGSLAEEDIKVQMPRFEFSSEPKVSEALKSLGMTAAFEPSGDFFGMLDQSKPLPESLYITDVKQKAFISVGELGTEAAAASAVTVSAGAMPGQPKEIHLTRPFLYLIRDTQTGQVVFIGQVVDPSPNAGPPATTAG